MNTIPQRRSRAVDYELEEDESYYVQRPHTSTRRYYDTKGNQVIQQGNKKLVIHNEPLPKRQLHWSFILGVGMILTLALWVLGSSALAWWQNHQLDSTYGMPRTFQADAVVYPSDTSDHPSHYIFLNLNGAVAIVEMPHGVIGSSVYVRNLSAFSGGRDSYSVKVFTAQDRSEATVRARSSLLSVSIGLHYPCIETVRVSKAAVRMSWRCQMITYHIASFYHVTGIKITGNYLLLDVWFVARPARIWVK
jgi:hypothetical protein